MTATWKRHEPYNALPPLPPDEQLCTDKVLDAADRVVAALADLHEAAAGKTQRRCLWRMVPLLDAWASSLIEQVETTPGEMLRYAASRGADADRPDTVSAVRLQEQTTVLWTGEDEWASTEAAARICSAAKGREMTPRSGPGTIIAGPQGVVYTPPDDPVVIGARLGELWRRLLEGGEPAARMARAAAGHYQFESIHPFEDGNGRTGRALIAAGIADARLSDIPACAVSVPILRHRQEYYHRLDAVRSAGALEAWTVFMLQMMAQGTRMCIDRLAEQNAWTERKLEETTDSVRWNRPAQVHSARQALSLPWCRTADLLAPGGLSDTHAARRVLQDLVAAGLLEQEQTGRRDRYRCPGAERLWTGE